MAQPVPTISGSVLSLRPIESSVPMYELTVTDVDWDTASPSALVWMTQVMLVVRHFEEVLLNLKDQGLVYGPVHTSIGQEAIAAATASALTATDKISGTHRAHHQFLGKVLGAYHHPGFDPLQQGLTPEMKNGVRVLLAEVMGLAHGCCGGRGGSMHLFYPEAGVAGTNAIVAGGVPHATGIAWADAFRGKHDMTVCFFGDGALYQGVVHESCNLAALWKAPIVYFVENNQYAVSTRARDACSATYLCQVGQAYRMPGLLVDGMNPLAVKSALEIVRSRREAGWLPCFIEANTYRYFHHAGGVPGSSYGYRTKDEEAQWEQRDPLKLAFRQLRRRGILDDSQYAVLQQHAKEAVSEAVSYCTEEHNSKLMVRSSLWPEPASLTVGVRDEKAPAGQICEAEELECSREISYSDAIAQVTGRWMEKDPTVVVLGEDIANLSGGPYGATKGLAERFPGRVRNTPITEAGFSGLAAGAAMNGLHPVVEIMFSSFVLVAADQLLNQIGQLMHIYGARTAMPLVVRTRVAIGLGYGAQHSLDPVALFSLFPGWKIYAPTTPFDYIGLFNAAMESQSPCLMVEHHSFYPQKGKIPDGPLDWLVKPGCAKVRRRGKDVTVVTYGAGVSASLEASNILATESIEAEVIELRSLDLASIDYDTIGRSLCKTNILVTVEEAPSSNSIGAKIASESTSRSFCELDGPPLCIGAPNVPIPVSKKLEDQCLIDVRRTAELIRLATMRRL